MDPLLQSAIQNTLDGQQWEDGDEEYDEDEDLDAEAEEIAKRLNDQLWADIAKAQAEAASAAQPAPTPAAPDLPPPTPAASEPVQHSEPEEDPEMPPQNRKQEAAMMTVRTILSFAFKDPVVRATLNTYIVHNSENRSVLDVLTQCASSNTIEKGLAKPLSDAVVALAKSDVLFSSMRNSDAAAIQLDKGKRKRDHLDDDPADERYPKKAIIEYPDLSVQIAEAVRVVTSTFASNPATDRPPEPALVSSIQFHLHQIFLFVMTSVPRSRPEQTHALQELGGMIQMLGVLSGVPIGPAPPPPWAAGPTTTAPAADIGTAVYPCMVPSCSKTFHRLYSLRTHQRVHTLVDRPYRCPSCPASFHRNHDLKRHLKLHDKTAFKCGGCGKVFSRRDAIKRHKDSRGRGGKGHVDSVCANAEIEEVEVDKEEGEEDVSRRAKIWNGIVANQLANANAAHIESAGSGVEDERTVEEGEIPLAVIQQAHSTALQLHPVIQSRVSNGVPPPPPGVVPYPPPPLGAGQPTLASVMARTQSQYNPPAPAAPAAPAAAADDVVQELQELLSDSAGDSTTGASISLSWLSEEQTKLLEQAIAQAAQAAQAQAEAEAALEEGDDDDFEDELDDDA
ncbi:hypothetical protein EIP86_008773 [Pleurotus ostreatoroseus]|nr:hypothetical protein EIP86_008773 [Pleurotus ostreatoroseus]